MGPMKVKEAEKAYRSITDLIDDTKAIATTLKPLDLVASRMEAKWGCGRLPRLVSSDLAAKFASAQEKLDHAIHSRDVQQIANRADVMIRGWKALDTAAEEAGHDPMPRETWSLKHDGLDYTVVLDRKDLDKVARMSLAPERVVSLNEMIVAWKEWRASFFVGEVKKTFPGAEVERVTGGIAELDDDIPF
jgi:hypothetical protein